MCSPCQNQLGGYVVYQDLASHLWLVRSTPLRFRYRANRSTDTASQLCAIGLALWRNPCCLATYRSQQNLGCSKSKAIFQNCGPLTPKTPSKP